MRAAGRLYLPFESIVAHHSSSLVKAAVLGFVSLAFDGCRALRLHRLTNRAEVALEFRFVIAHELAITAAHVDELLVHDHREL